MASQRSSKILFEDKGGGPSGAAEALFDIFKDKRAFEAKKGEADITKDIEGYRSGLRMRENEQVNTFNTSLQMLQQAGEEKRILLQNKLTEDAKMAAGAANIDVFKAIGGPLTEAGVHLPGFQTQDEDVGRVSGKPLFTPPAVDPRGAPAFGEMFAKGITSYFDKVKQEGDVTAEVKKAGLLRQLGLLTDEEHRANLVIADMLDKHDPKNGVSEGLRSFIPGKTESKTAEAFKSKALLETNAWRNKRAGWDALGAQRERMAKERNASTERVAQVRAKATLATADRQWVRQQQTITTARMSSVQTSLNQIQMSMGSPDTSAAEISHLKQQQINLEGDLTKDRAHLVELEELAARQTGVPAAVITPQVKQQFFDLALREKFPKKKANQLTEAETIVVKKRANEMFKARE